MEENKFVIYQTKDGQTQIDVRLENDTVWLNQAQMAELFQKDQSVVARHINNVFKEGELEKMGMCKIYTYHSAWRYEGLPLCLHKTAFSYTKLHFPT